MRLGPKLAVGILAASAIPLAIAGTTGARLSERALRERIEADHATLAVNAADGVARFFDNVANALEVYPRLRDLETSAPDLTTGVLRVAYRSNDDLAVVALLDDKGSERVPSVYVSDAGAAAELRHVAVSDGERDAFLRRVPVAQALAQGRAVGPVALAGEPPAPRAAVAVAFAGASGRYVLAADVSLARLDRRLTELSAAGTEVLLVDGERRGVAGGRRGRRPLEPVALPLDRDPTGALPTATAVARVEPPGKPPALAAFALAPGSGFGVLVRQPEAAAFARVAGLHTRTLFWLLVSGALAAIVGLGLAADVARRVRALVGGTEQLARGDFQARLQPSGNDELEHLARAFNKMAADLGTSADELARKNREISAKNAEISRWNAELEQRVKDKTEELRRAEDLLLRSRAMAAVGTLGAGMAHEINNPLTGILGITQLMLLDVPPDSPSRPLLADLEKQAQRIRAIVQQLTRLAERESGASMASLDLGRVVRDTLGLVSPADLERARVTIETKLADQLPAVRGDGVKLQDVLVELVTNARRAMPDGGRITISTSAPDPRFVVLKVSDTGTGIPPEAMDKIFDPFFTTKSNWQSTGMGLTMVHKVVEEHRGTIAVDSQPGQGASFTLRFPAASAAHLE